MRDSHSGPLPPRGGTCLGRRVGQVSWLEAAELAFPDPNGPSGWLESAFRVGLGPFTVAGPRRILTGFRDGPPAETTCETILGSGPHGVNASRKKLPKVCGGPSGNLCGHAPFSGHPVPFS